MCSLLFVVTEILKFKHRDWSGVRYTGLEFQLTSRPFRHLLEN
jgi:hypothetical protein